MGSASDALPAGRSREARTPPSGRSVRAFLIGLVVACLLPGIVGTAALLFNEYREGQAKLEKDTLQMARALAQAVDNQILRVEALADGLATATSLARGDLASFHSQARETLKRANLASSVVLINRSERQILNTLKEFGEPLPPAGNVQLVRKVFETGAPVVSDIYIGAVMRRPIMTVAVPVIVGDEVAYTLIAPILPDKFDAILRAQGLPKHWEASILDTEGAIAARTGASEALVGSRSAPEFRQQFTTAVEGTIETVSAEGAPTLSVFAHSPVTRWGVGIDIPRHVLEAPLLHRLRLLALGALVLFAVGLGLAWRLREKIARSFQALIEPAEALGAGLPVVVPKAEVLEATAVGAAMTRAANLLKARTAALQESEEKYRALFENMAEAFALCELIYDQRGVAIDFRCIEVNEAFYRETGLPGTIINCPAKECLPQLDPHRLDAYEHVVKTGESIRLENTDAETLRIFSITVFRPALGRFATVFRDITDIKRAQEALQDSERRLALALNASGSAVWEMEVPTRVLKGEDKFYTVAGHGPDELATLDDWLSLVHPDDAGGLRERLEDVMNGTEEKYSFEARVRNKAGDWRWNQSQAIVAGRDDQGRVVRLVGTNTDVTERKLAEQRVREAALHDPLTDLPNRALVFEYGSHLLAGLQRKRMNAALLFIDLDRFKPINDLHGHDVGDKVLQEVAKRLLHCTRSEDLVGRLGGDEFVILLPHLDQERRRAAAVAQHVVDSISELYRIDGLELSLSPSIGISYYPEHARDVDGLIHTADLAMYQAKQTGRAGYRFYSEELERRSDEAYSLEARLKNALRQGRLELHYQPVVDIVTGRVTGAEALIRLADDSEPSVSPASFIPIAESTGMIRELGEWVVREACRQHEEWLKEGLQIVIAINVSPLQFRQGFPEKLGEILSDTGADPTCFQIEVTESTVMESLDEAIEILGKIKSMGVKVALDDFGTGYSSLSRLSSLPLDKLKVDQSFVRSLESNQGSRSVTEAIIALGHSLKLEVVAEGIESEHALRYLEAHGCNQVQGFLFSRPLPPSQFVQWHHQRHVH